MLIPIANSDLRSIVCARCKTDITHRFPPLLGRCPDLKLIINICDGDTSASQVASFSQLIQSCQCCQCWHQSFFTEVKKYLQWDSKNPYFQTIE